MPPFGTRLSRQTYLTQFPELAQVLTKDIPIFDQERIPIDDLPLIFGSYKRYMHEGRFLVPDEVLGIMNIKYRTNVVYPRNIMFEKFDDPLDALTIKLDAVWVKHEKDLCAQIDGFFTTLRNIDEEASDREKALKGL